MRRGGCGGKNGRISGEASLASKLVRKSGNSQGNGRWYSGGLMVRAGLVSFVLAVSLGSNVMFFNSPMASNSTSLLGPSKGRTAPRPPPESGCNVDLDVAELRKFQRAYAAWKNPVFPKLTPSEASPLRVRFFTYHANGAAVHIEDGMDRSNYMSRLGTAYLVQSDKEAQEAQLASWPKLDAIDYTQDDLWVYRIEKSRAQCPLLIKTAKLALQQRSKRGVSKPLHLLTLDYNDDPKRIRHCGRGGNGYNSNNADADAKSTNGIVDDKMDSSLDSNDINDVFHSQKQQAQVRIAKRSLVVERDYDKQAQCQAVGRVRWNSGETLSDGPLLHLPYFVRSDIANEVQSALCKPTDTACQASDLLSKPGATDARRSWDVAHYWNAPGPEKKVPFSYRCAVSRSLEQWDEQKRLQIPVAGTPTKEFRAAKVFARIVGDEGTSGRSSASSDYVHHMVKTKIVVVVQRDWWEDHYRLFEAMSSGAMVMTDTMLSLPSRLVDGKHLVLFHNLDHLRVLLLHYLDPQHEEERQEIAAAGYRMAMGQHRMHHVLERIIFGKALTESNMEDDAMDAGGGS